MNFNNISFPHPVLGISDNIMGMTEILPKIESEKENYVVTLNYSHDNPDLENLVRQGEAEYICEVTCSKTVYRQMFKNNIPEISFRIPRKAVKGKVEFISVLVAKEEILSYSNKHAHPDYDNFSFQIDQGEVLGFFGKFSFDADIKYEKLKAVSSLMDVVRNNGSDYTEIDFSENKIKVQLPPNEFSIFSGDSVGKELQFVSVFHASIVLNALLIALYNFEQYEDKQWAKVITYRLRNEEQFQALPLAEKENIPEIAQRLLGNPFKRLLDGLQTIIDSQQND